MTDPVTAFRRGRREDAAVLAELVDYASEGLALHLWQRTAEPGESARDVGRARAARDTGSFSYLNARIIELDGRAAGCLIGYDIADVPEPLDPDMPAMFRPLQELENLAPGTWYVNVLAILPAFRNLGLGTQLLDVAERTGRERGRCGMSIIVADANEGARRLYERQGYTFVADRPMVKEDWVTASENWLLLTKGF